MLVLSRRPGEVIQIGENIRIVLVDCGTGRARIGIDAPREIPVWRDELLEEGREDTAAREARGTDAA